HFILFFFCIIMSQDTRISSFQVRELRSMPTTGTSNNSYLKRNLNISFGRMNNRSTNNLNLTTNGTFGNNNFGTETTTNGTLSNIRNNIMGNVNNRSARSLTQSSSLSTRENTDLQNYLSGQP